MDNKRNKDSKKITDINSEIYLSILKQMNELITKNLEEEKSETNKH